MERLMIEIAKLAEENPKGPKGCPIFHTSKEAR